jgi:hypothetical protein
MHWSEDLEQLDFHRQRGTATRGRKSRLSSRIPDPGGYGSAAGWVKT